MGKLIDVTGEKFGRLTVLCRGYYDKNGKYLLWQCICDCGATVYCNSSDLRRNAVKSCGCLKKEGHKRHGMTKTRLYYMWANMKNRCTNHKSKDYKYYGGRGIRLCLDWYKFENFSVWAIANGYSEYLTIERADNEKGYNPSNCIFIPFSLQSRNQRKTLRVTMSGNKISLRQLAEETGISFYTLLYRYKNGIIDEAIINNKRII